MNKFLYKNLFIYSSPQFCGNMEEYFSKHTQKLVVIVITQPSGEKQRYNLVRLYKKGKLIEENNLWSSDNRILSYVSWYVTQIQVMLRYFSKDEKFIAIYGHPVSFFGMTIQKLLRNITFVYTIGDYFPPISLIFRLFQFLKLFYHQRIPYAFYLSDEVNQKMNGGKIVNTHYKKTIMFGIKPKNIKRVLLETRYNLLFVGLIKPGQGIELALEFLKKYKKYSLKIIGISHPGFYEKYQRLIDKYKLHKQVYYPNRFFSDKELDEISKLCFIGIAPYTTEKISASYYGDVGKVKAYTEMGLPVILTNTTAIKNYIRRFSAGEIIQRNTDSFYKALTKIEENYDAYLEGVKKFNSFFYFETYYRKRFKFLEEL